VLDESDKRHEALRQYRIGAFNRRVAAETENLMRAGMGGRDDTAVFLCTCGRDGCEETLVLSIAEYERVNEQPHRFLVAPGHDAPDVDDVVAREERYWIVEVKPEYRPPRG
jgi:hypothetical protein